MCCAVYETPIRVALATAPQNGLCFAFDIRHYTATLAMFYICGFAAGGFHGGLGAAPPVKKTFAFFVFFAADKTCRGSELGLRDAKLWSGTAERSETAEGRENPNHRSFNYPQTLSTKTSKSQN